jgi:hypothetical protein
MTPQVTEELVNPNELWAEGPRLALPDGEVVFGQIDWTYLSYRPLKLLFKCLLTAGFVSLGS